MTYTAMVKRDEIKNIQIPDTIAGTTFWVSITPMTEAEADEMEFKSLKGIAGRELTLDDVRMERLRL